VRWPYDEVVDRNPIGVDCHHQKANQQRSQGNTTCLAVFDSGGLIHKSPGTGLGHAHFSVVDFGLIFFGQSAIVNFVAWWDRGSWYKHFNNYIRGEEKA
jgi:hypothetical protein